MILEIIQVLFWSNACGLQKLFLPRTKPWFYWFSYNSFTWKKKNVAIQFIYCVRLWLVQFVQPVITRHEQLNAAQNILATLYTRQDLFTETEMLLYQVANPIDSWTVISAGTAPPHQNRSEDSIYHKVVNSSAKKLLLQLQLHAFKFKVPRFT